jgi:hypothetical protein
MRGSEILNKMCAARDAMRAVSNSPHMAPIHALIRQGADEIAQVLPAFPDSNVKPQAELGQVFEITPQMATEQLTGRQLDLGKDQLTRERQKQRDIEPEMGG